jgi:hypothetical protein
MNIHKKRCIGLLWGNSVKIRYNQSNFFAKQFYWYENENEQIVNHDFTQALVFREYISRSL